ncbi:hypothetical protein Tco_0873852 [Tanacetum coccineum]|uniref:Uncharacterized protein n=1 Tax=Tanacetum coccineum TaxID=301880 RepID=A0ABQ5BKD5_9ASTR
METHNRIYISPFHTKKIFAKMRRQGKDFSRRETPLFPTMVVQAQEEMGEGSAMPTDPHHTPIITQPSSSQPQRKQKYRRPKEKDTQAPQSSVPSDPTNIADEAVTKEPSMQLKELMDFYTKLQQRVLDLENTKAAQAQEITSLKLRVGRSRRVESFEEESLGDQEDASKQGRIDDIDVDKDIYLVNVHRDEDMFGVNDLEGDEEKMDVIKEPSVPVSAASTKVRTVIPTTAAITITAVTSRPRAKGVKDKGKSKMVKEEPVKKMSKKELLKLDEELAFKLQVEEYEEERLAKEKAQKVKEANIAWDDIQAKVEADYQLAQRLQAQEQEELSDAEKATLFIQLLKKRRKHFEAKREKEQTTNKSSAKEFHVSKKQKVDDDKETKELKQYMEIISDDVTIEATPLSTKSPTIMYLTFGKMLKNFDKEDLEVLWSIVKAIFKKTKPMNYMDNFLHLNLKFMCEHHLEDNSSCEPMQPDFIKFVVEKIYPLTKHTLHQMFTLRYENKEYVLDEQIRTIDDDSTQEEIEAYQKHYDDATKCHASWHLA